MGTYKQFSGNAVVAHLTVAITGTPASFTVDTATGFPTAGSGQPPFVVCVGRGTASEEKMLISSQGSGVFQIQARGWDGTSSQDHPNGSTVEHVLDADTLNDSQQHIHTTNRDDHTQYVKADGTRAFTGGVTVSTGGLTVSAGGAQVTGNSKVTGALEVTQATTIDAGGLTVAAGGLTVSGGGAAVTGNSTVTGNLTVTGTISGSGSIVPSGSLMDYAGSVAPSGWLLCDGSAVSRTTYASLFSAIGTTWGAGDGSTTFNVPDFRGRATIGSGQGSGLTNRALAATGGEETHALTSGEMATHSHGVTDPGHSHPHAGDGSDFVHTAVSSTSYLTGTPGQAVTWGNGTSTNTTGVTVNNAGSGTAHNTMMPYAVVTKIIKA